MIKKIQIAVAVILSLVWVGDYERAFAVELSDHQDKQCGFFAKNECDWA